MATLGLATCSIPDHTVWPEHAEVTIGYRPGLTGKLSEIGTIEVGREVLLTQTWLSYLATPVKFDPVKHERPWFIIYQPRTKNLTARCQLGGKPVGGVIKPHKPFGFKKGHGLSRYHFPLPVSVPRTAGAQRASADDLLPAEAAGEWKCTVSVLGKPVRTVEFKLKKNGLPDVVAPTGSIAPLWWRLQ